MTGGFDRTGVDCRQVSCELVYVWNLVSLRAFDFGSGVHWLGSVMFVQTCLTGGMLTRARKLKNLILLGFTEQVKELLRKGPPTYLRELTDKLEAKAASTLERLQSWPVYDALQAS